MIIFAKHNPVQVTMMNLEEFGRSLSNFKFVGKIKIPCYKKANYQCK